MTFIARGWQAALIASVALSGCAARQGQGGDQCEPVTGSLDPGAAAESLEGTFRLVMVGTSDEYSGRRVTGTLDLQPHDSAMQTVTMPGGIPVADAYMPLYGSLDASVEEVGGVRVGETMSVDPLEPGVAVVQQTSAAGDGATTVTLRIGSEANRRDRVRFDGGFLALHVHEITPTGFAGSWASGVRWADRVGFFCAHRTDAGNRNR